MSEPQSPPDLAEQRPTKRQLRLPRPLRRLAQANVALVTLLSVLSALLLGAVLILATTPTVLHGFSQIGAHPGRAFGLAGSSIGDAYESMFTGAVFSPHALAHAVASGQGWDAALTPISETLVSATPLMLAGLGVAIGFSTGVFNIGAQGQLIAGALGALYVGFEVHAPTVVHLPLVVLGGAVGGGLAGFVPGFLKARTGAHEVITTIMFNYIMLNLLDYLLSVQPFQQPGQSNAISRTMPSTARLPHLLGSGLRVNAGLLVALAFVAAAVWFTRRSTLGFSFRVIGMNPSAGKTSGIDAKRVTVLVLVMSGALAGLAGTASLAGTDFFLSSGYGGNIGFDAITVALLGRNRPIGVMFAALLFGALEVGGRNMQAVTSIPLDLTSVIQALIVLFVATPVLVREIYRLKGGADGSVQLSTAGWGG